MNKKFRDSLINLGETLAMLVLALLVGALMVKISGNDPLEAYSAMLTGAFGKNPLKSQMKIYELLVKVIPLMMVAFAMSIAFKAQLWNIGAGGQFVMGSIASTAVALYVPVPIPFRIALSLAAAIAAGAFWGWLAGWLKVRFNANEVITTLMLSYIANCILLWLINGPMQDPYSDLTQSDVIPEAMFLPRLIGNYRLHSGIFILVFVAVVMCFFWKTPLGYQIELVGQGRKVATYSGANVDRTIQTAMLISGGLAGLAGWIEMFGILHRLFPDIASNYGDISNIIALLGGLNPYGIIASSFFFAVLINGGSSMNRMTNVPYSIVDVIQGLIIIFVIAKVILHRKNSSAAVKKSK